jgi:2-polyprenyl-6-methoxyphenol hydroxylase-like FAD-dependent oxidoreductase
VVIAGDAAHAGPPHLTQGAAMALEDAIVLAQELTCGKGIEMGLKGFMARRYERCRFVQRTNTEILETEQSKPEGRSVGQHKAYVAEEFRRQLALADRELDRLVLDEMQPS